MKRASSEKRVSSVIRKPRRPKPVQYDRLPPTIEPFVRAVDKIIAKYNENLARAEDAILFTKLYETFPWLYCLRHGDTQTPPTRKNCHALADTLHCTFEQYNTLLDAAGHPRLEPDLPPPTLEQVVNVARGILAFLPLPAYVITRDWNLRAWNPLSLPLFGITDEEVRAIPSAELNVLRFMVDPRHAVYDLLARDRRRWEYTVHLNIYHFKRDNVLYQYEPWYRALVDDLRALSTPLLDADGKTITAGKQFSKIWDEVQIDGPPPSWLPELPFPYYVTELLHNDQSVRIRGLHIRITPYDYPRIVAFMPDGPADCERFASLGFPVPGGQWPLAEWALVASPSLPQVMTPARSARYSGEQEH